MSERIGIVTGGGERPGLNAAIRSAAVELIAAGKYGYMVAYQGSQVGAVQITEATWRLKTVPPAGSLALLSTGMGELHG